MYTYSTYVCILGITDPGTVPLDLYPSTDTENKNENNTNKNDIKEEIRKSPVKFVFDTNTLFNHTDHIDGDNQNYDTDNGDDKDGEAIIHDFLCKNDIHKDDDIIKLNKLILERITLADSNDSNEV